MMKSNLNKKCLAACAIFFTQSLFGQKLIDLEKNSDEFVLETKQIIIPGFPGAFNASIVRWQGDLLMCFRIRDSNMISTFEMGVVRLDDNFNPISKPKILEIPINNSTYHQNQDPRLIIINKKLYILYSNFIEINGIVTRRMFVAQLHCEKNDFKIDVPTCLDPFEGHSKRWEKNWVPFNYNDILFLAYSLVPHKIFKPSLETGECETVSTTYSMIGWNWGELRGGTNGLLDKDEYIAFFHSSTYMATQQSQGKKMQHYFMGAYTFSSKPPFEITSMSAKPIIGKNFYNGPAYNTWKPLRVVFPVGCLGDENYLWVTYGRQDFEIWVAKIDKKGLYKSLVRTPVISKKQFEILCRPYMNQIINNFSDENIYEIS